jgi:uncharacterized protein YaiI (UPF0178 family)
MKIWVDADACPNVVKDILFKAADKRKIHTILVANQFIKTPPSPFLSSVQVGAGFDVADNHIVKEMVKGDLVITADIPLAAEVVEKQGWALNPRGEFYTKENIKQRLAMRNFMEEMRSTGQVSGGPPPLNLKDRQAFANELDKFISQNG